jgi:hypothetical protein
MNYKRKVIAYLDLLGFANYITLTDKTAYQKREKIQRLKNLFELVKELTKNSSYTVTKARKVTNFSDLIVISFAADDFKSVYEELKEIQLLCVNCANRGFLVRGSIIYGDIIHNGNMIFGPGLVQAYENEKLAKHPRIIIEDAIIRDCFEANQGGFDLKSVASKDYDGLYFIDYFVKAKSSLDAATKEYDKHILNLAKKIIELKEVPALKEKANWLFDKFKPMLKHYPLFRADADYCELNDLNHIYLTLKADSQFERRLQTS